MGQRGVDVTQQAWVKYAGVDEQQVSATGSRACNAGCDDTAACKNQVGYIGRSEMLVLCTAAYAMRPVSAQS